MRRFGAWGFGQCVFEQLLKPLVLLLELAFFILETIEFRFPQGSRSTLFNSFKIFFGELELFI